MGMGMGMGMFGNNNNNNNNINKNKNSIPETPVSPDYRVRAGAITRSHPRRPPQSVQPYLEVRIES